MGKSDKEVIVGYFPDLKHDENFKITSPQTPKYNCIAWAYGMDYKWMWPPAGMKCYDGVTFWPNENADANVEQFIIAFRDKGYEICENPDYEKGYQKIALYVKPGTTECTHAARQLRNGFWTSKLGRSHDIQHGTPYTIEGNNYGVVHCIMKRVFN